MRRKISMNAIACLFVFGVVLFGAGLGYGQTSFEGKTVRLLISERVGGGTDTAARLVGRFLPKYLPGNPTLIAQNMPGGGGITGANYVALQAKPDGLLLGQFDTTVISPMVVRRDVVKYDPLKFHAIGALNRGGSVIFVRADAERRLKDPSAKPVIVGETDGNRDFNAMILWGAEFLGWNIKYIIGYPGTAAMMKAFLQGETEMSGTGNSFVLREMERDGVAKLITQAGVLVGGKYERRSEFQEVPAFVELLGGKKPAGVAWRAYQAWVGPSLVDKWLALPPGTPSQIVKIYRRAFDQIVKDPEFLGLAKKQLSEDVTPIPGIEVESILQDVIGVPDEALSYAAKMRKKYGLPEWR